MKVIVTDDYDVYFVEYEEPGIISWVYSWIISTYENIVDRFY